VSEIRLVGNDAAFIQRFSSSRIHAMIGITMEERKTAEYLLILLILLKLTHAMNEVGDEHAFGIGQDFAVQGLT